MSFTNFLLIVILIILAYSSGLIEWRARYGDSDLVFETLKECEKYEYTILHGEKIGNCVIRLSFQD